MMDILRADLREIANLIKPQSKVLDIGSGDGTLLYHLKTNKDVIGRGIEIKPSKVNACLAKGISVIQGDAEEEILQYPSKSFDYVVLSRTLPATKNPIKIIREILRVGHYGLLSMPNFGYWKVRLHLLLNGTMPVTSSLDMPWYITENIHLCTVKDFIYLMNDMKIDIEKSCGITNDKTRFFKTKSFFMNLFAEDIVFMIKDKRTS